MAFVTAYLARSAQRSAGRTTVFFARNFFEHLSILFYNTRLALSEAQELRRTLTQKHPFIDY